MNGFEVYKYYAALKAHFTSKKYNAFAYQGKTRGTTWDKYEARNDRPFFERVAKHHDPRGYLLANILHNSQFWIGGNDESDAIYAAWKGRVDGLMYHFEIDLGRLDLAKDVKVKKGTVPGLIQKFLNRKISLETLTILLDILPVEEKWKAVLGDDLIVDQVVHLTRKYRPFLSYSKSTCKSLIITLCMKKSS